MARKRPTVLIVDNHPFISAGLQSLLEKRSFNVREVATTATQAVASTKNFKPDLALLELTTTKDCFKTAKSIRSSSPQTKVVFYSSSFSDGCIQQAVKFAVDGLILTSDNPDSFVPGLESALNDRPYYSPSLENRVSQVQDLRQRSGLGRLGPRELEVLCLLAEDNSVKETAEILGLAPTTVETHRQAIRAKLQVRSAAGMALVAVREGLITP